MVDFHTHILPNLDDGASSVEEANQMILELKKQGVNNIVLTPHYYADKCSIDEFVELRDNQLKLLDAQDLNVVLGAEVFVSSQTVIEYDDLNKLAINNGKYILIEFPHSTLFTESLFLKVEQIISLTGLVPVIAHAEKYYSIHKNPKYLSNLVAMGCLIQINVNSFFNNNKRLVKTMLKKGLVHCLGTDCHNMTSRQPKYERCVNELVSIIGKEDFDKLQNEMKKMLRGDKVVFHTFEEISKVLGFYI